MSRPNEVEVIGWVIDLEPKREGKQVSWSLLDFRFFDVECFPGRVPS